MEPTSTIMYDFWEFLYFSTIFTAIVAYVSYKRGESNGYGIGYSALFNQLVRDGVLEYEVDETDEPEDDDIY